MRYQAAPCSDHDAEFSAAAGQAQWWSPSGGRRIKELADFRQFGNGCYNGAAVGVTRHRRPVVYGVYGLRVRQQRLNSALMDQTLNSLNGKAVNIKQITNTLQELNVFRSVVATAATTFERAHLGEFAFPKPQDVLWHVQIKRYFTDGAECPSRFSGILAFTQTGLVLATIRHAGIDAVLEHMARAEDQYRTRQYRHFLTRLRVAPDALPLFTHEKTPKR